MHQLHHSLSQYGRRLLLTRAWRTAMQWLAALGAYYLLYFLAVLGVKSFSLTWPGLLYLPTALTVAFAGLGLWRFWQLRNAREVARRLEVLHPHMALRIRSALDFVEGKSDQSDAGLREEYVGQVVDGVQALPHGEPARFKWTRYAASLTAVNLALLLLFFGDLSNKFYNPSISFGQTHLDLNEGSITIFEPEYTQIPGRTLPLKPGSFSAYPGSRVRFMIDLPEGTRRLFLEQDDGKPIELPMTETNQVAHEFVLLQDTAVKFLVDDAHNGGQTQPYLLKVKQDHIPEVLLRSHTPEGMLNVLDPLIVEVETKDDFGVKMLEAVVTWEGGEKRIPIAVPVERKNHFITRNQWYLSDLDLDKTARFSIYFEARDNNPINGPGVGRSRELTYELESPERKYDEFMEIAKQLLDTMTHTLGDNLDTELPPRPEEVALREAKILGQSIQQGLYRGSELTNLLITKVRETPNITRLDQNFLYKYRNNISRASRMRAEMETYYNRRGAFNHLRTNHRHEEIRLENLTYELLLQLKIWAVLELERQNNELEQNLDQLQQLLDNSENMDQQELMKMFEKLMNEVMKEFQEMMEKAAQQMDMSMEEFMNMDANNFQQDQMQEMQKKIMEALKEGDMEKAKRLMEEMRRQMQGAMNSMQQAMGEMSPEMQEMMKQMREFMGLLRELKAQQEKLEGDTQGLRREMDQKMGGNQAQPSPQQQAEQKKIMENIHRKISELHNRLVDFNTETLMDELQQRQLDLEQRLETEDLSDRRRHSVRSELRTLQQTRKFIEQNGLDRLQNATLRSLEQTEKMQEYLDQGELMLSLETGQKLDSFLSRGENVAHRSVPDGMENDPQARETFGEARNELMEILDALRGLRNQMEQKRQNFMQQSGENQQEQLAQRQQQLQEMIQQFQQQAGDSLEGSPLFQKLGDIQRSMRSAEGKLNNSQLEGAVQYEQDTLQRIGELMEQLQQAQQPSPGNPMPMMGGMPMQRERMQGDPLIKDFYIPDSQKKASRDEMKDAIRKQLQKNLPDEYGKEIRKYYEKLMDQ
ncbi:DUF4175 family protein [Acanthopleuribacter pedis]|uniref:DUF4175 domain-containing protein n=1 Tax=Acanthopleuribacter pedis TaxID=442870 RepID=A0A8J7QIM4_9BACT|nr:DUF4175 family protein [Acanthopleuribacter pedis]MBO1323070.1 hypothetical protein [Acanthopleuribacter pedis]